MTLEHLEKIILQHPEGGTLQYSLSKPFPWQGGYTEVAFTLLPEPCLREQLLERIDQAKKILFTDATGNKYRYFEDTQVNFEASPSSWSGGAYCAELIAEIEGESPCYTQESRLARLAFRT